LTAGFFPSTANKYGGDFVWLQIAETDGGSIMWHIIVNPTAGRGRTKAALPTVVQRLKAHGIEHEILLTDSPGHATELARRLVSQGATTIGAAGGDGTVHEVINGLAGTSVTLAVIPTGTGNDLARALNIPLEVGEAIDTLSEAPARSMDYGVDIEGVFGVILGLGFTAQVMDHVNKNKDFLRGPMAIAAAVLKVVNTLQATELEIILDGVAITRRSVAVFVMNSCWTGGGMYVTPQAKLNDGLLHLCLVNELGKLELLRLLPKVYSGQHVGHRAVEFHTCKEIVISTAQPIIKMFDGNVYGKTPVSAKVVPQGLKVLSPGGPAWL